MRQLVRPEIEAASRTHSPTPLAVSFARAAMMVAASGAGLLVKDLYHEVPWAREALRGGDIVTLVIATPLLIVSAVLARRGSARATLVWLGVLGYNVYNYAYYAYGTTFNDAFLLHIGIFTASLITMCFALAKLDRVEIQRAITFRPKAGQTIGVYLILVGIAQAGLWVVVIIRNAITGQVLHDIPVSGQHLVFALDLTLLMPVLVFAGLLLVRTNNLARFVAPAVASGAVLILLNLCAAAVLQHAGGVPGTGLSAPSVLLVATMIAATAFLLRPAKGYSS